ncbi:centromere protein F isoform X2 [Bufo gargarizans]|uniref:centromere protein F isoform X2 n=1 Tax=Bufo gargarizans TaxID=30331 RepID=UPI001CF2A160|nr:centromere protein F isoform X2 [Bufo gargarizans]
MSWVVEEWKEGLPSKTLQKIQELEAQLDKLKKERQQKQLQLESLEAAFQKQKQKVESEKSEATALKRENQSLIELCDHQEKTRQKLSHEQQAKDTQINFLDGQLSASKKHIEKLEQDLKRYKNDLERSQQSSTAADMSVCVTPQKSLNAPFTPVKFNDSKYEELQEKYSKEVEERKKLETELKILQMKLANQTSQPTPQNTMNHRDIARHQSSSSVFSWQQERTPGRTSSSAHDPSLKRNYSSIQYPWDPEETPSKRGFRSEGASRSFSETANNPANDQLRSQNQELRSRVNELELRLEVQEKELKNQLHKLQETQTLMEKTQAELAERDKTLSKSREDLARITVQFEQSVDKCTATEQKLKKVSEELSCQRQNAESARLALEQKLKEQERENQQELLRQQNSLKDMEQQLNQTKSKLSQESQQAKNEFNAIQSELDRATHGKKALELEVDDLKQKLSRSEQAVSTGQNHVTDLKKDLEEARTQQNAIKSQLDQKIKEALKLEDEFRTANQTLRQDQVFIEELKNKNNSLDAELKAALQKLNYQDSTCLENLKVTVTNLEKERNYAKEMLQTRENDLTEMKNAQTKMSEELSTLKNQLHCKEQECKDLGDWKNECENNTVKFITEKEETSRRIKDLETTVQNLTDQISSLENNKRNLHTQIKTLQDILDVRTSDLEVQKVNCTNLNSQMVSEGQKYQKEIENLLQKISELEMQRKIQEVDVWSNRVSFLENELETQKLLNAELQDRLDLLLRNQQEVQEHVSEVEGKPEGRLSNSTSSKDISSKPSVDSFISTIREKEEEINMLSEKLNFVESEMESMHQNNKELKTKLQELNLLSESWSAERETLSASVTSLHKDLEKLTEENKVMGNALNDEKTQQKNAKIDNSERDITVSVQKDDLVDGSKEENGSQDENPNGDMTEWKEKALRIQKENSRLLRANEELSSLIGKLRDNESSLNKVLEELRICLKDKETSLRKAQTKLELMNKSFKEEDFSAERVQEPFIGLQSPTNFSVENNSGLQMKENRDRLESPKEKKATILNSRDETIPIGTSNQTLMDNSLLDITEDISLFTPLLGSQNREENLTLRINMDQLTLASANDTTLLLPDLTQLESPKPATFSSPFNPPPLNERVDRNRDRKSITSEIVDLLLQQSPTQQQQVLSSGVKSEDFVEMKDLLLVYQMELSRLQKHHLSEITTWQQKLKEQALEMEAKLSAEKAETERLTQELEAARLELQVFDLSARSLLAFDNDDLTTKFDAANQTICTVLPIGGLSLGNHEPQTSGQSPEVVKKGVDANITENANQRSPTDEESSERASRLRKRRKGCSGALETQDVSQSLHLKTEQKQLGKEREEIHQNLVAEIKDLSAQIEMLKTELHKKDKEKQDLVKKSKKFEVERLELLENIELILTEKSQFANKIVGLEKELNNSLNAMEIMKQQISELSSIQESLEISSKECKENYLQTQSELKKAKSETANIENHALSLEADLDALQSKCQHLQEENEGHLRSFNEVQENLNTLVAEKCQLNEELESLVEEKEELEQMYKTLKIREQELESCKSSSKELIKVLEAELRTLKEELQAAKLTAEQLTAERNGMVNLQENGKMQVQQLQDKIQSLQEEKKILVNEQENHQMQVNILQAENVKLSRILEQCQREKHELGSNLNSAREEVALMRTGIEKLKVKIEADEKKKHQLMEKLKDSERKFDKLNDKIESLERELLMSEENFENAILQTETSKDEVESVKEQKEALEIELNSLRKKIEELEGELQSSKETMVELEATITAITKTMENKETEHAQLMDISTKQQDLLQVELEELLAQKALSDQKYETAMVECADISSKMKQQKEQLQEELEKAQTANNNLKVALQKLTLDQEECKIQLDKKTQQLVSLESQAKDTEQWEMKYSSEVSRYEVECENLKNQNNSLQAALDELEEKVRAISAENESLQSVVAGLKNSCSDLEGQMESTKSEQQTLLDKVAELEDNCSGLQSKLQDADLHLQSIKEQRSSERRGLDEEMQAIRRQHEHSSAQLLTAASEAEEMKKSVASLQRELESQAKNHKDDIVEYEKLLAQAESHHQTLLDEVQRQVAELEDNCSGLQSKLQDADLHLRSIEEQRSNERRGLDEEMQAIRRQHEHSSAQLLTAASEAEEMKKSVASLQRELESQAKKHKDDIMEYEKLLAQAESHHQTMLDEVRRQVAELEDNCSGLQSKLQDADLHLQSIEEQRSSERRGLGEEMQAIRRQHEDSSAQLLTAASEAEEMKKSVASLQRELESQAKKHKDDIMEYEKLLAQAESHHQTMLDEVRRQVAELEDNCSGLQSKLQDADLHLRSIEEQRSSERRGLDEEMQAIRRQHEDSSAQLLTAASEAEEMKKSVASLQRELESQAKKHKDDIVEYEKLLAQAESHHQSLLDDARRLDGDLASYRQTLTSLEASLNVHKQEIDCLKAGNGELNESLCKAREQLAELEQLKINLNDLEKENAKICSDLHHWMKSCKELEGAKEQLQARLSQQEETLKGLTQKHDPTDMNTSNNDFLSEIEELKQYLEEKTLEADESVEKYCNLMIKTHKLEEANDTLKKQVDLLSTRLKELEPKQEAVESQTLSSDEAKKRRKSTRSIQVKQATKRRRESENMGQNPSTPQAVTKKVKKNGSQSLEEKFEPEGLSDVVKKGFSDIPSGKQSPFVLRRTAAPLRRSPRQRLNSPSVLNTRIDNLENLPDLNSPTPGGSKAQVTKATEEDSAPMDVLSPLVKTRSRASDNMRAGGPESMRTPVKASLDDTEEEGACQVQ